MKCPSCNDDDIRVVLYSDGDHLVCFGCEYHYPDRMLKGKPFTVVFEPDGKRLAMRMGSKTRAGAKGALVGHVWLEDGEVRFEAVELIPISISALRTLIQQALPRRER